MEGRDGTGPGGTNNSAFRANALDHWLPHRALVAPRPKKPPDDRQPTCRAPAPPPRKNEEKRSSQSDRFVLIRGQATKSYECRKAVVPSAAATRTVSLANQYTVLLVDVPALPPGLETALGERNFTVESAEAAQVSGTLLVSAPQAVLAPAKHAAEVARAIRGGASQPDLPFLILAPLSSIAKLQGQIPREVTAIVADSVSPAAIAVRLQTAIKKTSDQKPRPRTLMGVGGMPGAPTPGAVAEAIANAVQQREALEEEERTKVVVPQAAPIAPPTTAAAPEKAGAPARPIPPPPPGEAPFARDRPAEQQRTLRIALVDDDVTRADAVSRGLREKGHTVFLVASDTATARWALLRRFAPQVFLAQDESLAQNEGSWKSAVARDPFLRPTPWIPLTSARVFDEETGSADLRSFEPRLEGLGKAEQTFAAQLKAGGEIEVDRAEINPGRLLALLSEFDRSVSLTLNSGSETMSWKIVGGVAGAAEASGGPSGKTDLTATQALDRLLKRPTARLFVQTRGDLVVNHGKDVVELLAKAHKGHLPKAAQSANELESFTPLVDDDIDTGAYDSASLVAAARAATPALPLGAAASKEGRRPSDLLSTSPDSRFHDSIPPDSTSPDSEEPTRAFQRTSAPAEAPLLEPEAAATMIRPVGAPERAAPPPGISPGGELLDSQAAEPGAKRSSAIQWAGVAAVAFVVGGGGAYLLRSGNQETPPPILVVTHQAEAPVTGTATAASATGLPAEAPPEPTHESPASLWKVSGAVDMEDCESLLQKTPDEIAKKPKWQGELAWKNARRKLMIGKREEAHSLMCQAAFINPSGPATLGLAGLYLEARALQRAHQWAERGVKERPDSNRKSKELLGDVLSQMGKADEAQALWLETLKLGIDDRARLRAVSRSLAKGAAAARKGGDYAREERLLRRAASFDGENPQTAAALARVLLKNEQIELATRWAQFALGLDPTSPEGNLVMGDLRRMAGKNEEARSYYEKVPPKNRFSREAKARLKTL